MKTKQQMAARAVLIGHPPFGTAQDRAAADTAKELRL